MAMITPEDARQRMINRLVDKDYTQKLLTKYNNYDSIDAEDVEFDDWNFDVFDPDKHPRNKKGQFRRTLATKQKMMDNVAEGNEIKTAGPSKAKDFIQSYIHEHPEKAEKLKKSAVQCKEVLNKVRNFQKMYPNAENGTYSATSGKLEPVDIEGGWYLTFHQNHSLDNPYEDYTDDDYAMMCAITKEELGSDDVYIGYFGNAEVSFHCSDFDKATRFAVEQNQNSIFDNEDYDCLFNKKYNKSLNPTRD